ncbi:MAG: hypothetical protein HYY93_13645 [Planctomycetes bacterium]|nr:hypothetical protein [Planctomycetota bacterium]
MSSRRLTRAVCAFVLLALGAVLRADEKAGEMPVPPPIPPPAPAGIVLEEMTTSGALAGPLANFTMTLKFTALDNGWATLPLFSQPDISVTSTKVKTGDSKKVHLRRTPEGYELLVGKPASYVLEIQYVQRIRDDVGGQSLTLPFVPATKSLVRLVVPGKELRVTTTPTANVGTTETKDGRTEIFVYGSSAGQISLIWQPKAAAAAAGALAFAEQTALLAVSKGSLHIDSLVKYTVLQGHWTRAEIELSPDLNLLGVTGPQVKNWDIADEGTRKVLRIDLTGETTGEFPIALTLEKTLTDLPSTFPAPVVKPLGVEREKGILAVAPKKGLKVEASDLRDASQVDLQDLSLEGVTPKDPIHLAFRYLKRPFGLSLNVQEVEAKVTADVVTIVRVSKESMRLSSTIEYAIRDAGVFHFRVKLGDGLKLIDIVGRDINNWAMKDNILSVDLRSKAEGTYTLVVQAERLAKETAAAAVPAIEVLDVERERGYIGLAAIPGVRVETASLEGINQINVNDFPVLIASDNRIVQRMAANMAPDQLMDGALPDLAFRYLKHPYKVAVHVADVTPEVNVDVQTTVKFTERDLELESRLAYDIRKAGVFTLRVTLPKSLRVTAVEGANIDDWKREADGEGLTVILRSKTEGGYVLVVKAEGTVEDFAKPIPVPRLQCLEVKKERGFVGIRTDPAIRMKTDPAGLAKITEMDIKDLPPEFQQRAPDLAIAYKYFEQPWSLALAGEKIKSRVTAETFAFLSIGEALLSASAAVKFQVLYAGVSTFRVKLPPGVKQVNIEGALVKHKDEVKKPDGDEWTVTTHAPQMGEYALYITYQKDIVMKAGTPVTYTGLKVLDVERETGYLAIAARPDVELIDPAPKELTRIDEKEIPEGYKNGITIPILMAFRYLQPGYELAVNVSPHESAAVLIAIVEAARLSTTITEEGKRITDIVCQVRNTFGQYLEFEVTNQDMQIMQDAIVGGMHVGVLKTTRTDKTSGKTRNVILVPIAAAAKQAEALGRDMFTVMLRFGEEGSALGQMGTLDLSTPPMSLPALRLGWSISLPEGYELVTEGGNMKRLPRGAVFEGPLQFLDPDQQAQSVMAIDPTTAARQIAEKRQGDLQCAGNAWIVSQNSADLGKQTEMQVDNGYAVGIRSTNIGTKPRTANTYDFQTLVSLNEPGRITCRYVKRGVGLTVKGALFLLFVGLPLLAWRKMTLSPEAKAGTFVAASVVMLAVQALYEPSYYDYLTIPIWTVLLLTVLLAAGYFLGRMRDLWLERRANAAAGPGNGRGQAAPPSNVLPRTDEPPKPEGK